MATPITWHNVNGPSLAEASRPLDSASRSFDNMFSGLTDALKERKAVEEANWLQGKTNNTNAGLAELQKFRTAAEFEAAQKTGAINAILGRNGAQVDQAALRNMADGRLSILQGRDKQGIEFGNTMTDQAQAPLMERARQLIAAKKFNEAQGVLDSFEGRQESAVQQALATAQRDQVVQGQADTKFNREGKKHALDLRVGESNLLTDEAQRGLIGAQTSATKFRAETDRMEAETKQAEKNGTKGQIAALDALIENNKKAGPMSLGTFDTAEGKKNLLTELTALKIGDAQKEDILYNLSQKFKNGVTVGIEGTGKEAKPIKMGVPVSAILEAIAESTENPLAMAIPGWSRRGDAAASLIEKRFANYGGGALDPNGKPDTALIEQMQLDAGLRAKRDLILNKKSATPDPKKQTR